MAKSLSCPSSTCGPYISTSYQCQTYQNSSNSYIFTPCEYGLICPVQPLQNATCTYPQPYTRYPGDYCFTNLNCISANCTSQVCQAATHSFCNSSADCNPGSFCRNTSKLCTVQLPEKASCSLDEECINSCYCDLKVCIKMFSKKIGEITGITWNSGLAITCSSGFAKNASGQLVCSTPPSCNNTACNVCGANDTCVDDEGVSSKPCYCGLDGNKYCPLFESSTVVSFMIASWSSLFQPSSLNCNTLGRWNFACFYQIGGYDYSNYLQWSIYANQYFNNSQNYPNYPSCMTQTVGIDIMGIYGSQGFLNLSMNFNVESSNYSQYFYTENTTTWNPSQCVFYSDDIYGNLVIPSYLYSSCPYAQSCPLVANSNSTCISALKYPGESCTANSDCYSQKCSLSKCIGLNEGQNCNSSECNPGLFCNLSGICQVVFQENSACSYDIQCGPLSMCNLEKCIPMFSLPPWANTTQNNSYWNYYLGRGCQSGLLNTFSVPYGQCEPTPNSHSPITYPQTCSSVLDCWCKFTDGSYAETYEYSCILTELSNFQADFSSYSYCHSTAGDTPINSAISSLQALQQFNITCNSEIGLTAACVAPSNLLLSYYYNYTVNFKNFIESPYIYLADSDYLSTFESEYFNGKTFLSTYQIVPQPLTPCLNFSCSILDGSTGETCENSTFPAEIYDCDIYNYCNENSFQCTSATKSDRATGEYCEQNSDCYSDYCSVNNVCVMGPEFCTSSLGMPIGYYCNLKRNLPSPQQGPGQYCMSTEQCLNSLVCSNTLCVTMFSLSVGTNTDAIDERMIALACVTGYASFNGSSYSCDYPPISVSSYLIQSNSSRLCNSNRTDEQRVGVCGLDGNSYCPLFQGDEPAQKMIAMWPQLYNFSEYNCNTLTRWSYYCFAMAPQTTFLAYLKWAENSYLYYDNSWVYKNLTDPCKSDFSNRDYNNIVSQIPQIEANTTSCVPYFCTTTQNTSCAYHLKNIYSSAFIEYYDLNLCYDDYECNPTESFFQYQPCQSTSYAKLYPGEYCNTSSQCINGVCKNHRCSASDKGGLCQTSADCNPGLYCSSNNQCSPVLNTLAFCNDSSQCNTYSVCALHQCVPKYSLSVGEKTQLDFGGLYGYSSACESGFANITNSQVVCAYAPYSNSSRLPIPCTAGELCYDSSGKYAKSCECGYDGRAYCPAFEADSYLVNAIYYFSRLQEWNVPCNAFAGLTAGCFVEKSGNEIVINYQYYYTNLTSYLKIPELVNNSVCVQASYNRDYWTVFNSNYKRYSSFGSILIVAIGIIGLI